MPRMYSSTGRSRWPLVIGAAAAVIVIGGGVVFATTRDGEPTAAPTSSAPAASVTPSPTSTGSSGAGDDEDAAPPTGCLGGQDRNAAMVLAAQEAASHSSYGAVEVATAYYRFIWQSPVPAAPDVESVESDIISSGATDEYRDLAAIYEQYPNVSGTDVADGTPFHLSTTNGLWMVDANSTADRVTVNVAAGYVIDGALSPTKSTAQGFVMVWQDGGWHVEGGSQPDAQTLANGGVRYTGGC
jgi:hypothetical protein